MNPQRRRGGKLEREFASPASNERDWHRRIIEPGRACHRRARRHVFREQLLHGALFVLALWLVAFLAMLASRWRSPFRPPPPLLQPPQHHLQPPLLQPPLPLLQPQNLPQPPLLLQPPQNLPQPPPRPFHLPPAPQAVLRRLMGFNL